MPSVPSVQLLVTGHILKAEVRRSFITTAVREQRPRSLHKGSDRPLRPFSPRPTAPPALAPAPMRRRREGVGGGTISAVCGAAGSGGGNVAVTAAAAGCRGLWSRTVMSSFGQLSAHRRPSRAVTGSCDAGCGGWCRQGPSPANPPKSRPAILCAPRRAGPQWAISRRVTQAADCDSVFLL